MFAGCPSVCACVCVRTHAGVSVLGTICGRLLTSLYVAAVTRVECVGLLVKLKIRDLSFRSCSFVATAGVK